MARSVVVIGAGQGGLTAAIYARLRGFDVVLLERGIRVGGKAEGIQIGDYRLDPGPSIVILPRIYESVFRDAGRRMNSYIRFRRLDPISQVRVQESSAFDLPADRDDCMRLVKAVAPDDAADFGALLHTLDRVGPHVDRSVFAHPYDRSWQLLDPHLIAMVARFNVRATYKELIDGWFKSPLLRAFFYGFPSYGGQTYDSKAPGALLIPYLMLTEGVFYPDGGVAAIPQAFRRLAEELGVEVRTGLNVVGLRRSPRRVTAVVLEDGSEIAADAFISNVDRSTTRAWLGHVETAQPSFSYFTVHLGIRKTFADLAHHTLLIPQGFERSFEQLYRHRTFPDSPIVYVNATAAIDPNTAPPGCSNLFAVVTSPAESPSMNWKADEGRYCDQVMAVLARFGIEFNDRDIDFNRIQTPSYFALAHGNYRGSLYGVDEKHRLFGGLFPMSNRDREYRNLFYCGGSVQPGAGLPMVTLSGKFAAQLI